MGNFVPSVEIQSNTVFDSNRTTIGFDSLGIEVPDERRGGAIYNRGGDLVLRDSFFSGNVAEGDGGGIFQSDNGKLFLNTVVLRDNESMATGGALFNDANLRVVGSRVANNQGQYKGGFADGDSGASTILDTIFANNSG